MPNTIGEEIRDWGEIRQVAPHYEAIKRAVLSVSSDMVDKQVPLIMQPIWKTDIQIFGCETLGYSTCKA